MNLVSYLQESTLITKVVLLWLSIYFVITFTILISRIMGLNSLKSKEEKALNLFLMGSNLENVNSILKKCINGKICREKIQICISLVQSQCTSGLTWLSIIASTSPFIGLFGTVVSILNTFSKMAGQSASISTIAPAISEALVATGVGIFVAIPAYTFHLLIKRKIYEIISIIERSSEVVLLNYKDSLNEK